MNYLLVGPSGSWRQLEIDSLPDYWVKKHAKPDSAFQTVRFHDKQFEVLTPKIVNGTWVQDWTTIASVALNGGLDGWIDNCQCVIDDDTERLLSLLNGAR